MRLRLVRASADGVSVDLGGVGRMASLMGLEGRWKKRWVRM